MPTWLAFYRDVLRFEVASDAPDDGMESELILNTAYEADSRPPAPYSARVSGHADSVLFFGCEDVEAAYAFLQQRGAAASAPVITGYGLKQLYLKDPDGDDICLQQPVRWSTALRGGWV